MGGNLVARAVLPPVPETVSQYVMGSTRTSTGRTGSELGSEYPLYSLQSISAWAFPWGQEVAWKRDPSPLGAVICWGHQL